MEIKSVSLSELSSEIQNVLQNSFTSKIWVKAEIGEFNESYSGHVYLELVEKDEYSDKIMARAQAVIWVNVFRMLKPYFETTTGQTLGAGIKVLLGVLVEYHPLFGFKLNVRDIEPAYTLGDLALKRKVILQQLFDDGVLDMNKELEIPLVPQKIAVISSSKAAGYEDFVSQINNIKPKVNFQISLFQATMQGENAAESIICSLNEIFEVCSHYDIVVIIRGRGAALDLNCFDNYDLAYLISQFPLPVITGIGHHKDNTVVDIVAHTKLKTPTAVADFIIDKSLQFIDLIEYFSQTLREIVEDKIFYEKMRIGKVSETIPRVSRQLISENKLKLQHILMNLKLQSKNVFLKNIAKLDLLKLQTIQKSASKIGELHEHIRLQNIILNQNIEKIFQAETRKIEIVELKIKGCDPQHILDLGYSVTLHKGKVLKNACDASENDLLEIYLKSGVVKSKVLKNT